jgi:hypothetical protein
MVFVMVMLIKHTYNVLTMFRTLVLAMVLRFHVGMSLTKQNTHTTIFAEEKKLDALIIV